MGTGGTLPTNITQQVTLYNTTGVIEKDKGIYFCPFIANNIQVARVYGEWLRKFKLAVNYDNNSPYSNITISQWNPKDRSLVIKGNADDFRLITEEGKCFNYLILSRIVTKGDDSEVHYYAFFITDVQQAGQGSVRLELQPDDFTNVFYLHNTKRVRDYATNPIDVFNERLKNCYVNRQHYNRVSREDITEESYYGNITEFTIFNSNEHTIVVMELPFNPEVDFGLQIGSTPSLEPFDPQQQYYDLGELISYEVRVENNKYLLECHYPYQDVQGGLDHCETVYTELDDISYYHLHEDNLSIFSQIEEGFKYKRQFRDYKEFINYGDPLTEEEKTLIENEDTFENLPTELQNKCLKLCTGFLHIVFNTRKIFLRSGTSGGGTTSENYLIPDYSERINMPNSRINNGLTTLCYPIYQPLEILGKYNLSAYFEFIKVYIKNANYGNVLVNINSTKIEDLISMFMETTAYPQYIVSAYITKESSFIKHIDYDVTRGALNGAISVILPQWGNLNSDLFNDVPTLVSQFFLPMKLNGIKPQLQTEYFSAINQRAVWYTHALSNNNTTLEFTFYNSAGLTMDNLFILFIEDIESMNFDLDLSTKDVVPNVKEDYYDTVLTFNPYSFWSVSYLGRVEVPLNKLNYYENPVINCDLTVIISDVVKYNFMPTYEINSKKIKYYTESMEQTFANQITISSSKLVDYVIANQSQMRNQFAINDMNLGYGLVEAGIGAVGDVASGYLSGGLMGGLGAFGGGDLAKARATAGGIKGITEFISVPIQWGKGKETIGMNQKAKLADMGNLPSNLKQVGTDITIDLSLNELGLYLNHYRIDEVSYNSICKYLERFGYTVNIYDSLHVNSRVGWDFVQLNSFDYDLQITVEQEDSIRQIFQNGVTLLHDHSVMTSGHNYETILD